MAKKSIFKDLWKRSKDGSNREERSFLRVAVVATVLFTAFLLVKKDNLIRWAEAGLTIHRQNKEILARQAELDAMDQYIYNLKNNRDSLEKFARERHHFTKPGDDLYILPHSE